MRINTNVTAINSHRQYGINSGRIARNMERLSSGFRVNRAADDAAGLAISEKMRAQIRGLNQASRNTQDAISMIQIAEGGMQTAQDIMHRVRELAVQAANETNTQEDRNAIALEVWQLNAELQQIGETTEFNGIQVLRTGNVVWDGSNVVSVPAGSRSGINNMVFQVGANFSQSLEVDLDMSEISRNNPYIVAGGQQFDFLSALSWNLNHVALAIEGRYGPHPFLGDDAAHNYSGVEQEVNGITVPTGGRTQTEWISYMIGMSGQLLNDVSMFRANLGALQNRLEFKMQNLNNAAENASAAESRIRDVDMAQAMTDFTRNNILFQASTAMLAQANSLPQSVLQLLG